MDECVEGGVLLDRGTSVAFRHELARQAILDALPPGTRVDLHRRVLVRLTAAGSKDHRRLAEHAVACGEGGAIVLQAPRQRSWPAGLAPTAKRPSICGRH